jgi:hypothetical protein
MISCRVLKTARMVSRTNQARVKPMTVDILPNMNTTKYKQQRVRDCMDISKLREPLQAHQIDFRVQSINKGGYATILAYKDARVDQQTLDDVVGPLNWQRRHTAGNHNCIVSIWCGDKKEWVSKEDTGTESNTEAAKGLASDSFKRACFNWGIGRELYDYPLISIKLDPAEWELKNDKAKQTWNLKLRDWVWYTEFCGGHLCFIAAKDDKGKVRFKWGIRNDVAAAVNSVNNELNKADA